MKVIIDGINRVLSPVCAFLSGIYGVIAVMHPDLFIRGISLSMSIIMGWLSYLAYKHTIRRDSNE